jgi:hypothetical protein
MTIQPYDVRTAFGKPTQASAFPKATPEEYLAKLRAKFGDDALTRLHKLENRAARTRNGNATMHTIEVSKENGKKRRDASVYTQADRKEQILALLPATSREVAARLGFGKSYATDLLSQLGDEGRVKFRRVGQHTTMWERAE